MDTYCESPEAEILQVHEESGKSDHDIIIPFMKMAKELDHYSRNVVDKKMCSRFCPCFMRDYHTTPIDVEDYVPLTTYFTLEHSYGDFLPNYGRSRHDDHSNKNLIPLYWSRNESISYEIYTDCLKDWIVRSTHNRSIDLAEIFGYTETLPTSEGSNKTKHLIDANYINFYAEIEEKFQCSGMCNSSLFYYS